MNDGTRALTRSALSAAVCTVLLFLASVAPSGRLALIAAASLGVIFVSMSVSWRWALGVYGAASLLSLLLLPQKLPGFLFAAFLGWYPLMKLRVERLPRKELRILLKLLVFNLAFVLAFFLSKLFFPGEITIILPLWVLWLGANAAFLVYDYAVKVLILLYIRKFAGRVK